MCEKRKNGRNYGLRWDDEIWEIAQWIFTWSIANTNGNDYYTHIIEKNDIDRLSEIQLPKSFTLKLCVFFAGMIG